MSQSTGGTCVITNASSGRKLWAGRGSWGEAVGASSPETEFTQEHGWHITQHAGGFYLQSCHGRLLYARTDGNYEQEMGASADGRVYRDSIWQLDPCDD